MDSKLSELGIEVIGDERPLIHAECIRIARRLEKSGRQVIGLWPAGPNVAIPPLAVQLGAALVELTRSTVAYVDANVRYPATLGLSAAAKAFDNEDSIFATLWLRDALALIIPTRIGEAGAGVPQLRYVIAATKELFSVMLVDLTGFDRLGDHLNMVELLNGVVLVGRSGSTREGHLLDLQRQLPAELALGCVLLG